MKNCTDKKHQRSEVAMGLYVHWPYCVSKCPYCDFNSHVARAFGDDAYLEAIRLELDYMAALADPVPVSSIFFGGGTPSLMPPSVLAAIIEHIKSRFDVMADAEITLEANPSSSEASRFAAIRDAGVNRLSLGVQAFDDDDLQRLGRPHSAKEALTAIRIAADLFPRYSFDLIYARHGQKLADWREELKRAIDMSAGHLSIYQLTVEPGTRYHTLHERGELALATGYEAELFFEETRSICDEAGLPAYEISNHARPGAECRHNLIYWRYAPYIGVGPGAHGRLLKAGARLATATLRSPVRWMAQVQGSGHGYELVEPLSRREQADEMVLMGLRLAEGIDLAALHLLTGFSFDQTMLDDLQTFGLCAPADEGRKLRATEQGVKRLDSLIIQLSTGLVQT